MRRVVGQWIINWAWFSVIDDHGDGTCTILAHDRSKTPPVMEHGRVSENDARNVVKIRIGEKELTVDNPQHVFSYPKYQEAGVA